MTHTLSVLSRFGHSPLAEWSPKDVAQIQTAEQMFNGLRAKGFRFFDATEPTETKTELVKFDPKAKEVVGFSQLTAG